MGELLDSIRATGYGVAILGVIGTAVLMLLFRLGTSSMSKHSSEYMHEFNIFRMLFRSSSDGQDQAEHIYLLILSCTFTLGSLMLTCALAVVFQVVKMSDPNAYYPLVILFIATVFCLFGVIKGIDSINSLMDAHIKRRSQQSE